MRRSTKIFYILLISQNILQADYMAAMSQKGTCQAYGDMIQIDMGFSSSGLSGQQIVDKCYQKAKENESRIQDIGMKGCVNACLSQFGYKLK